MGRTPKISSTRKSQIPHPSPLDSYPHPIVGTQFLDITRVHPIINGQKDYSRQMKWSMTEHVPCLIWNPVELAAALAELVR